VLSHLIRGISQSYCSSAEYADHVVDETIGMYKFTVPIVM